VDGFIFKSKSPTIGLRNIKVYSGEANAPVVERGTGFFAGKILEKYPDYPFEEEDRLRNRKIRHHFLTHLYTFADFRRVKKDKSLETVQNFLDRNKFLFLSYNKDIQKKMLELVKDDRKPIDNIIEEVESLLKQLMAKPPAFKENAEAARLMFNYLSEGLSDIEKQFFEALLTRYEQNKICFSSVTEVLKLYSMRAGMESGYHTFLEPYPDALIPEADEDRDKNFWKQELI
jgi:uncharacterized protein YbgA (DUF1722 family)